MAENRIQKLLFSNFVNFDEMVLVESPFAQTTKDGVGIRQVQLGLTPTSIILATDILPEANETATHYDPGVDPAVETFELIAIYPVECVNLSVYRRRKRKTLKAHFCNNQVLYFELGGFEKRNMFWNLWCEKVKFLCPEDSIGSKSETSAATSTTGSTLYLLDQKFLKLPDSKQLWCKFGIHSTKALNDLVTDDRILKWNDRNLFIGKDYFDLTNELQSGTAFSSNIINETAVDKWENENNLETSRSENQIGEDGLKPKLEGFFVIEEEQYFKMFSNMDQNMGELKRVNRFAEGINEGCKVALYLTVDDYMDPQVVENGGVPYYESLANSNISKIDFDNLAEACVVKWEIYKNTRNDLKRIKHRRRYGISPQGLFLFGFGSNVTAAAKYSIQIKRAVSMVAIRKMEELPINKCQLIVTISCESLNLYSKNKRYSIVNISNAPIYFWTPSYCYRPIPPQEAYQELRQHLQKFNKDKDFLKGQMVKACTNMILKRFGKNEGSQEPFDDRSFESTLKKSKHNFFKFIFGNRLRDKRNFTPRTCQSSLQYIQQVLRTEVNLSVWDFDSTTLAEQLTLIDRDLYQNITPLELEVLLWKSNRSASNIAAIIAFSRRLSCLLATEILQDNSERLRARLLARLINVADKCHRLSNFQSCRTILRALQSPAVYRLENTWNYLRKKHSSKYLIFEYLSKMYRDPRLPSYQKLFYIASQSPNPFLPSTEDLFSRLLDRIPLYKIERTKNVRSFYRTKSLDDHLKNSADSFMNTVHTLWNNIKIESNQKELNGAVSVCVNSSNDKFIKFNALYDYFNPLDMYEDNREIRLLECSELLERSQISALHYNFKTNELCKNYLLKARYKEDIENFFTSLRLETR